ncbi:MAG: PaaI family thioesterase [Gammaproteobacteria bacterium]|nr:PaaI family thioesterase [Gammaproteobacteria bacterium]
MRFTPEFINNGDRNNLPGFLGMVAIEIGESSAILEMPIKTSHLNILKSVHGGSVVALADTAAGYATYANLPEDAEAFTTIELKCNFIRGVGEGILQCRADCIHKGRKTQVWDATVTEKTTGKRIAEFRCTQFILYPRER